MNAALEILGFSKFLKALYPNGTQANGTQAYFVHSAWYESLLCTQCMV